MIEQNKLPAFSDRDFLHAVGFKPEKLGVDMKDDVLVEKFAHVARTFAALRIPLEGMAQDHRGQPFRRNLRYGIDWKTGRNNGDVKSGFNSAASAIYHGEVGVEPWRPIKTIAFNTPDDELLLVSLRADRKLDMEKVASIASVSQDQLTKANLEKYGLEYGQVNPFLAPKNVKVCQIFDQDIVTGPDSFVITTSGDPRFYIAFNANKFLWASTGEDPQKITTLMSKGEERVYARRDVVILGGDGPNSASLTALAVKGAIARELQEKKAYFGDRSFPKVDTYSLPELAGSIDTDENEEQLRQSAREVVDRLAARYANTKREIVVVVASGSMNGVAGGIFQNTEGVKPISPVESVKQKMQEIGKDDAQLIILGLSSAYDEEKSAFVKLLPKSFPVEYGLQKVLLDFVNECKVKDQSVIDSKPLYTAVESIIKNAQGAESLKGKDVVVVPVGSEITDFLGRHHRVESSLFTVVKSNDNGFLAKIKQPPDPNKIRLICILPSQTVAEAAARAVVSKAA